MTEKETPGQEIELAKRPLIIFDLETTGLDSDIHEILEMACLVVDPETAEIKKEYHSKVRPEHIETASKEALKIANYSPEGWQNAKSLEEVLQDLKDIAREGMFAGWNVSFDRPFLEKASKDKGVKLSCDYHWIDIMSMAYFLLLPSGVTNLGLSKVCQGLNINHIGEHTAMGDVKATLEVYRCLKTKGE